jgi:miniconductance mechanosensitive channel
MDRILSLQFLPEQWMRTTFSVLLLLIAMWLIQVITRAFLRYVVHVAVQRTDTDLDDLLFEHKVPHRAAQILPLTAAQLALPLLSGVSAEAEQFITRILVALVAIAGARALAAAFRAFNALYERSLASGARPIKSYIQLGTVALYLLVGVFALATIAGRSPWALLTGLGAAMAIILLIFRDTLLSLVASIQISNGDLIRVGDWIEMPQFNADGDVVDIALHTVRIQNWDKTFTVVPTHKFLDNSFKNWRGMFETGGRRIKRAIAINSATIRFLSEEDIERFAQFRLLTEYIAGKRAELAQAQRENLAVNARRLTNIGTLRAYIDRYLAQHPGINQEMTRMVRQLAPTPEGVPIEIYCFTRDTRWVVYEGVQADIFDHILAMVPEFGLQVYQRPSGADLVAIVES